MTYLILLLLSITLGFMVYQDVRHRHIHIGLPLLCCILAIYINKDQILLSEVLKAVAFVAVNFVVITAYFSIKNSKVINPFKAYVGLGDLLFLLGVIPLFSFRNYILFFISGMIFSLILYAVFFKKRKENTIPLAGYLSLYVLLLIGVDLVMSANLFYDFII